MRDKDKSDATGAAETPAAITPEHPLVIDLPDGQKLVVGNMVEGSVIEVATWRGTGRPDSRTSRLMLGMSPGSLSPTVVTEEGEKAKLRLQDRLMAFLKSLASAPKNLFIKKDETGDKQEKKTNHKSEPDKADGGLSLKGDQSKSKRAFFADFLIRSSHEQAKQEQTQQEQAEIDKWLESIRNKSSTAATARKSTSKSASSRAKSTKAKPAARKSKGK
jgi:hypothetical protein